VMEDFKDLPCLFNQEKKHVKLQVRSNMYLSVNKHINLIV
jgi:hypothetical protein